MCDSCPAVFHHSCLVNNKKATAEELDDDDAPFHCYKCVEKKPETEKFAQFAPVGPVNGEEPPKKPEESAVAGDENNESEEPWKICQVDPPLPCTSHELGRYLVMNATQSELPNYNYGNDTPVSEEEASTRAFYAVVWPFLLSNGWRESSGEFSLFFFF